MWFTFSVTVNVKLTYFHDHIAITAFLSLFFQVRLYNPVKVDYSVSMYIVNSLQVYVLWSSVRQFYIKQQFIFHIVNIISIYS